MFHPVALALALPLAVLLGFAHHPGWLLFAAALAAIQIARLFIRPAP